MGSLLGDPDLDFSTFDELEVATHVLALMVRGVQTTVKFMLVYFLTQTVVSYQYFWRAVVILKLNCHLQIVAMSANRKFFTLHKMVRIQKHVLATRQSTCLHPRELCGSLQMYHT